MLNTPNKYIIHNRLERCRIALGWLCLALDQSWRLDYVICYIGFARSMAAHIWCDRQQSHRGMEREMVMVPFLNKSAAL